ncbi:Triacylglycerol lipase protein [Dioscorea alata]|uniref:Triacylglycerol lipase protein n=1 Tax=Dioscorea alata TaxID=55571 RepID=A0ACB7U864_DIOAL|nr:Triacylglycerol lipase protein [Dioscorea alata]
MGLSMASFVECVLRRCLLLTGLRSRSIQIDSDTTLHCWLSKSLSIPKPNSKPVLLLIHGFGPLSTWQWYSQIRPLSRHYDLVIPDLVFFGESTTRSSARSEVFQAESLARLMDTILTPGRRFDVVGTSYGGFVAYHMARSCGPEKVRKVVIASSDLLKKEADDRALAERGGVNHVSDLMIPKGPAEVRRFASLVVYKPPKFMPDFVVRDVLMKLFNVNVAQKMELMRSLTLPDETKFQLTPLPQEAMLIWGQQDRIFP